MNRFKLNMEKARFNKRREKTIWRPTSEPARKSLPTFRLEMEMA